MIKLYTKFYFSPTASAKKRMEMLMNPPTDRQQQSNYALPMGHKNYAIHLENKVSHNTN